LDHHLEILSDPAAVAHRSAELFAARVAASRQDPVTIALAGGTTPAAAYKLLSSDSYRHRVDWHRIQFYFGDERAVPPDHPDSNYRLANESLFAPLAIPSAQVHRMKAEMEELDDAAQEYTEELKPLVTDGAPQLDLILLGVGADGHTASLFPGSPILQEHMRWVMPVLNAPKPPPRRLTLTLPVLNAGRQVIFLVTGREKAAAVREALEGVGPPEQCPAKLVRPGPDRLWWVIDKAAAAQLTRRD
jgi:6-phosphogluconolactonase